MSQPTPKPVQIGKYIDAVYPSYALMAGMKLGVFTALEDGPKTVEQAAKRLGVKAEKLAPLLYALAAANLLTVEDGCFANTEESDFYLVERRPAYLGDLHAILAMLWQAASMTAETVRTGQPQAKLDYHIASLSDSERAAFRGLHKLASLSSRDLMQAFDLSSHRRLIDIGGGTGGLAIALAQALPEVRVTLVDLPSVIQLTETYVAQCDVADRIEVVASDVVRGAIEGTYDGATMRSFTQVLSPDENQAALRHTFALWSQAGGCTLLPGFLTTAG